MNPARCPLWLAPLLAWTALAAAQFPPPGFVPPGGCPPSIGPLQLPSNTEVVTPAHYFPAQPATAERPAFPVAITVWRIPCAGGSGASLWLRMTLNPDSMFKTVGRPLLIVEQDGVPIGHFGNIFPSLTAGMGSRFHWDPTFFDMGTISAGAPITGNVVGFAPFDSDRAFTLRARHASSLPPELVWPASTSDLRYHVPARGTPGNVASVPEKVAGLWWNPAEPGWGLVLDRNDRGAMFAAWLTYDDRGDSTWYVMTNSRPSDDGGVEGAVYALRGQPFARPDLDTAFAAELTGRFALKFSGVSTGEFTFTVNGRSGRVPIKRMEVRKADGTLCNAGRSVQGVGNLIGWAAHFEGSPYDTGCGVHATLMTYDAEGKPSWLFSGLQRTGVSSQVTGDLYRPRGTPYGVAFDPGRFAAGTPVGTWNGSWTVVGPEHIGTLRVDGVQRALTIRRFQFEY